MRMVQGCENLSSYKKVIINGGKNNIGHYFRGRTIS